MRLRPSLSGLPYLALAADSVPAGLVGELPVVAEPGEADPAGLHGGADFSAWGLSGLETDCDEVADGAE